MRCADLAHWNFSGWAPFNRGHRSLIIDNLPSIPGVYVVGARTASPMKRGRSDLVYVGSAANQDGLRLRIRQYYHPGPSQVTNKRILSLITASDDHFLSYLTAPSGEVAKKWETAILNRFYQEHGQLPPENKRVTSMNPHTAGEVLLELETATIEWSSEFDTRWCSVCHTEGRVNLAGGNDPFYNGLYVWVCECGKFVCDDDNCEEEHSEC